MKVPFHLRRRPDAAPATALLVPSQRAEDLIRACMLAAGTSLPPAFAVADGFVLKLPQPSTAAFPGLVRLRGLSANLLLPVDANLVPALLADEAAGLVRDRGLVFLPGGRVLEFAPTRPVPLTSLLRAADLRREEWQPLPEPAPLIGRIEEILLNQGPETAEDIVEAGGEGIGEDAPRPADAPLPARALGRAGLGLGKALAWLGSALGLRSLTALGARLMAGAVSLAPRLSEALLGRQEAALRELLRMFQVGNIEQALRHALPLNEPSRGPTTPGSGRLPNQEPRYDLRDLLAARPGGGGLWFTPAQLYQQLRQEYTRLAEEAIRTGDHRRAAFIYARLLGDYPRAAEALSRGGLHHDAAVIYLIRLKDSLAAATEFEAAGEIDRALELYRQRGEHERAGDLLRRAGEEEQAVAEYVLAAAKLVESGQGHYQAGQLLLRRAQREDLALPFFEAGWGARPHADALACAIRLAQLHTRRGDVPSLLELLTAAEAFLQQSGDDATAVEFFNEVARLADQPPLARVRGDLRDRALLGIAARLASRVEQQPPLAGDASALLAQAGVWAPAVVSDAHYALRTATRRGRRSAA